MDINEEKRQLFFEKAEGRVNNVIHSIEILEPMARSTNYDYTKEDIDMMFEEMENSLSKLKEQFYKKFEEKHAEKKRFSFGATKIVADDEKTSETNNTEEN